MDLPGDVARRVADLAPDAGRLLVAVSGGADSVAALRLLHASDYQVVAAHLDHRLRADSAEDASFVSGLCAALDVDLVTRAVDVSAVARQRAWNLEDAARRVRYSFLHRAAGDTGCDAIVVAHTLDDQAETFLFQALRGSAYPAGMPDVRGMVIRPLLDIGRDALREYLASIGQSWREDPTNRDATRTRAWLRAEVMPLLTKRYPAAGARLARTARSIGEARVVIDELARTRFGAGAIRVSALALAPRAVQRSGVAALLRTAAVTPDGSLVDAVVAAAEEADRDPSSGPWRRSVGADAVVRVAYGRVEVVKHAGPILAGPMRVDGVAAWREVVRTLPEHGLGEHEGLPDDERVAAWLAEHGSIDLRHRADGDRVRLPHGHRLLSDLLIDRKVPREERDGLLVLAAGSDVLWVSGVALDGGRTADERFMALAIEQAELAAAAGELPVGAVLVRNSEVLAAGHNRSEGSGDPSAHAELEVMRGAGSADGDWRLPGATLYVTLEPCPMCFGAVLQTRIERVVYGADNLREGALGGVVDLRAGPWKRSPQVIGGVLAAECRGLLERFFSARRGVR